MRCGSARTRRSRTAVRYLSKATARVEERFGLDRDTGRRLQADGRHGAGLHFRRRWRSSEVHADPYGQMRDTALPVALRFQQDPRDLAAAKKHVIGPFERDVIGFRPDGVNASRNAKAATKDRCAASEGAPPGRIRSVAAKLPSGMLPGAAPATPACGLHERQRPFRSRNTVLRPAARLRPWCCRSGSGCGGPHPRANRPYQRSRISAAAAAGASIPKRFTTPSTMIAADAISPAYGNSGIDPSSPSRVSPKYIR
jgi:hypothetical protein